MRPLSRLHGNHAAGSGNRGFSILEVLVAVSIAAGVISLLVPTLMQQASLGEQTNRLTAVEVTVTRDQDWIKNYTRLWKLKVGTYPVTKDETTGFSDVTRTYYSEGGASIYEPSADECANLATYLLQDIPKITTPNSLPPYSFKESTIPVISGGVKDLILTRTITPLGDKIQIAYNVKDDNNNSITYTRNITLFIEAATWCDRLP